MNLFEQTVAATKVWNDAQQQIMNIWGALAQAAVAFAPHKTDKNSFMAMADVWRETIQQGIHAMTSATDPTAKAVIEKLFASQIGIMRLLELSEKVWQSAMPVLENGGDWEAVLKEQLARVRDELLLASTEGLHVTGSYAQLWQTFLKEGQAFSQPWIDAMTRSSENVGDALSGKPSALIEMTNLYWDAYRDTFGNLLQAPGIGYSREVDEKLRRGFTAWLDVQQAIFEYHVILTNTWVAAFEQVVLDLARLAQESESVEGVRDFLNRWSATADGVFKQAFRSEEYIKTQGKLVNAIMTYRQRQRQINEVFLQIYDLPTRSEVDEAHRRVYELRKEVKSLRKELAALKSAPGTHSTKKNGTARKSRSRKSDSADSPSVRRG